VIQSKLLAGHTVLALLAMTCALPDPAAHNAADAGRESDVPVSRAELNSHSAAAATAQADGTQTIVDISSFGADSTGVTDSAPAIRAAIASIGTTTPTTLYFPKGTYLFASADPAGGTEECVRITSSISLAGDGPGMTIFASNPAPACGALIGYFFGDSGSANSANKDYSYETDPGYAVAASTAAIGSSSLTLVTAPNASLYSVGQFVYLRGSRIAQPGEYHGELNQIAASGNGSTGMVGLAWPLSSDFRGDSELQLNLVASTEVVNNVQISGISFNTYSQAVLGAQVLGLQIFNNAFNSLSSTTTATFQFNQDRQVDFYDNTVNNPTGGPALDPARNPTDWNIHDNVFNGNVGAGEAGANITFSGNTISCVNVQACVAFGATTGNTVNGNSITVYDSGVAGAPVAVYDANGAPSPDTVISNNLVVANGVPAIRSGTPGTVISGNTIFTTGTGLDLQVGNIKAYSNSVTLTTNGFYGCVLVEGLDHSDTVKGLQCTASSGVTGSAAVWVSDDGFQTTAPLVLDDIAGTNLTRGIYVSDPAHDCPVIGFIWFNNVTTPGPGTTLPISLPTPLVEDQQRRPPRLYLSHDPGKNPN